MRATPIFSEADTDLRALAWRVSNKGYAHWSFGIKGTKKIGVRSAHRMVMERVAGRTLGKMEFCDHINRNKMDNRRENLRIVTPRQSAENRPFRGCTFNKACGKWQVQVQSGGKQFYVGLFPDPESAIAAHKAKRAELGFITGAL